MAEFILDYTAFMLQKTPFRGHAPFHESPALSAHERCGESFQSSTSSSKAGTAKTVGTKIASCNTFFIPISFSLDIARGCPRLGPRTNGVRPVFARTVWRAPRWERRYGRYYLYEVHWRQRDDWPRYPPPGPERLLRISFHKRPANHGFIRPYCPLTCNYPNLNSYCLELCELTPI